MRHQVGNVLPGFERVNRYWDRIHKMPAAKILPGEYYVTQQEEIITTVLGSCVSACIWDKVLGIGGMNHFMLPLSRDGEWEGSELISAATRYGNYAMEHMINDIIKFGGHRKNLAVKIFGGGQIISDMSKIGQNNVDFVFEYIKSESLELLGKDVGDRYPRKIVFYPLSGRVKVKKLKKLHNSTLITRERAYQHDIQESPVEGMVELF